MTADREESEEEDKPTGQRRPRKPDAGDNGSGSAATHSMPRFILLTRDGRAAEGIETEAWPDDFNEHDGGEIVDLGDGETLYKINYDNAYHLRYRLSQRGSLAREAVTEKFILGISQDGGQNSANSCHINGRVGPRRRHPRCFRSLSA